MKKKVDVSVIVPNYNNARYLDDFIQSVINSTVEPAELIIVDDGSRDHSNFILKKYNHLDYLFVVRFEENRGFATALNAALHRASCEFIMRADPDDMMLPGRMETQLQYLLEHPEVDVVGSNVVYFNDRTGNIINQSNFPLTHAEIVRYYQKGKHGTQHPTVCVRAETYKGYNYVPGVFPSEDYELFARMVRDGHVFANIKDCLYKMRVHPDSSTSTITYDKIKQTFDFRDQIFNTKSGGLKVRFYFFHIYFYRKFQLSSNQLIRYFYLLLSAVFVPSKLVRRFLRK